MKTKQQAVMEICAGVRNDGLAGHSMRDGCYSCAPFWEQFPTCPVHKTQLTTKLYCKACRTHYTRPADLDLSAYKGFGGAR